jgi:NAD(P)-dependent dehydrogenase (short-subunit alcohol dehydrogenase family)
MDKHLANKVALVTGGSRGLGVVIAEALADQGADVAISYVASEEKAAAVVSRLKAKGVRAVAIKSDQGDTASAEPLIAGVVSKLGKIDVLVNNAAIALQGVTIDNPAYDSAAMDRQWAVNAAGVIANIRSAARHLPEHGRIISVSSGLARRVGWPGAADYAGTKAAITGFSRGVARDLGPRNITVNVVEAGIMETDMTMALATDGIPPALFSLMSISRLAKLEEVAAAVAFLATPAASYITGSVIEANGGYMA